MEKSSIAFIDTPINQWECVYFFQIIVYNDSHLMPLKDNILYSAGELQVKWNFWKCCTKLYTVM